MQGTRVHICTKYEVFMFNPPGQERCAQTLMPLPATPPMHDGQSMIVSGFLILCQMSQNGVNNA